MAYVIEVENAPNIRVHLARKQAFEKDAMGLSDSVSEFSSSHSADLSQADQRVLNGIVYKLASMRFEREAEIA